MMVLRQLRVSARPAIALFAAILAVKLALLAFDPSVRLFVGDSASYAHAGLAGWVQRDRSYLYG